MGIEDLPETEHNPCLGNLVTHSLKDSSWNERISVVEKAEIKYANGVYRILFIGGRCKDSKTTLVGSQRAFHERGFIYLGPTDNCLIHMCDVLEYTPLVWKEE